MGTVISVVSGKGGTGKSSTVVGVGIALSHLGKRVLCIDFDFGMRCLDLLFGCSDTVCMDCMDVMAGRCSLSQAVTVHPIHKSLFLLLAPVSIPSALSLEKFNALVSCAKAAYDYILIDTSPGLGVSFQSACAVSDGVLVLSHCTMPALRGSQLTANSLPHTIPAHIILNGVKAKQLSHFPMTIDEVMDYVGLPLLGMIPNDVHLFQATSSVHFLPFPAHKGACAAYQNIARRLTGEAVPLMRFA